FLKFGVRYLIGLIILLRAQRISDGTHRVVAALRRSRVHAEQNEGSERQSAHHAETACGSHLDIPQSDYKTSKKMLVGAVGMPRGNKNRRQNVFRVLTVHAMPGEHL